MKNIYDLTTIVDLANFPWENVCEGMAKSHKSVVTYYGDIHSTRMLHNVDNRWKDKNEWRWYNAFKEGVPVEGLSIMLTTFVGDYWWARLGENNLWTPTHNLQFFSDLQIWIKNSNIFESTGRQLFFIQLPNQHSPSHVDYDPEKLPVQYRKPTEFIWLTPGNEAGKTLLHNEIPTPKVCWFNQFIPHKTLPTNSTAWSLRIDGKFTKDFKDKIGLV